MTEYVLDNFQWLVLCSADTPLSKVKLGEIPQFLARQDYRPIYLMRCATRGM